MGKISLFVILTLAVMFQECAGKVISWVASNPTMWTDSVGYLIPMLLVVFALLAPKYINRYLNR
jgi:hypothetical protein